jgi:uncharacterized protein YdeI (YjbR/CyaY-like superfamily)
MARDELPVLGFETPAAWEAWLADNHAFSPGVWLKIAKAGSGARTLSHAEALDTALCFGWIDGQKGRLDDDYWLSRFTPRRPGSRWSSINTGRAAALIEAGRMRPAGIREIELARSDGRWDAAYPGQRASAVPADLQRALTANDAAREFFGKLSSQNRYAILYRIGSVKRPETRAAKIAKYVAMLAEGKTIYPQA